MADEKTDTATEKNTRSLTQAVKELSGNNKFLSIDDTGYERIQGRIETIDGKPTRVITYTLSPTAGWHFIPYNRFVGHGATGLALPTADETKYIESRLKNIEAFLPVHFRKVEGDKADMVFLSAASMKKDVAAYANASNAQRYCVYLKKEIEWAMDHEIGHMLGLSHPDHAGEVSRKEIDKSATGNSSAYNTDFTVMSYVKGIVPMAGYYFGPLDIYALQGMYGSNTNAPSRINPSSLPEGHTIYAPGTVTIWLDDNYDNLYSSLQTQKQGHVESFTSNGKTMRLAIGTELAHIDASKRTKPVRLQGNALRNTLVGGTGDDSLTASGDGDTLTGGSGRDGFFIEEGRGHVITDFDPKNDYLGINPEDKRVYYKGEPLRDAGGRITGTLLTVMNDDGTVRSTVEIKGVSPQHMRWPELHYFVENRHQNGNQGKDYFSLTDKSSASGGKGPDVFYLEGKNIIVTDFSSEDFAEFLYASRQLLSAAYDSNGQLLGTRFLYLNPSKPADQQITASGIILNMDPQTLQRRIGGTIVNAQDFPEIAGQQESLRKLEAQYHKQGQALWEHRKPGTPSLPLLTITGFKSLGLDSKPVTPEKMKFERLARESGLEPVTLQAAPPEQVSPIALTLPLAGLPVADVASAPSAPSVAGLPARRIAAPAPTIDEPVPPAPPATAPAVDTAAIQQPAPVTVAEAPPAPSSPQQTPVPKKPDVAVAPPPPPANDNGIWYGMGAGALAILLGALAGLPLAAVLGLGGMAGLATYAYTAPAGNAAPVGTNPAATPPSTPWERQETADNAPSRNPDDIRRAAATNPTIERTNSHLPFNPPPSASLAP